VPVSQQTDVRIGKQSYFTSNARRNPFVVPPPNGSSSRRQFAAGGALTPKPTDRVLEIGTGSGYQAAILSRLVAEVYTIEIIEPLAKRAEADLRRLGFLNVKVLAGDGYKGWPEYAPFDSVIVTCAPDHIPQALIDQLQDDGRMIIPVGVPGDQQLYLLRKHGAKIEQQAVLPVFFVPMTRKPGAEDRP
jgi:protein-L-isoaspartate(D-aspartate) O-methyltransferase